MSTPARRRLINDLKRYNKEAAGLGMYRLIH
jgi:hypothetical protein